MKQNGYTSFAGFYDRLTSDVDYAGAAAYLLGLFRLHGGRTDTLLDLACGSGSLSLELARQGADIIGVDGSEDMLALAQEKAAAAGLPLLFLHQDMRAPETVPCARWTASTISCAHRSWRKFYAGFTSSWIRRGC